MSTRPTKKTAAKAKTRAAATKPREVPEADQAEQNGQPAIQSADRAQFARALGLNPDFMIGSPKVEFDSNGVPYVTYTAVQPVTPQQLAYAFMASGGMLGQGADGEAVEIVGEDPEGPDEG